MAYYADDIRRIAKQGSNNPGLDSALSRGKIFGNTKPMTPVDKNISAGLTPPLTFTALTYDDTKDVVITDDGGTVQTFKTVATAMVTDANGNEYEIDTVVFTAP